MAKNYLQDGKTLTFIADEDYKSGDMVRVGDRVVVAVTDVLKGCAGTGMAEGVFTLPKKTDDVIQAGKRVYYGQGGISAVNDGGGESVGVAWEDAVKGASLIAIKLHG